MVVCRMRLPAKFAHCFRRRFAEANAKLNASCARNALHGKFQSAVQLLSKIQQESCAVFAAAQRTQRIRVQGDLVSLLLQQSGAVFYISSLVVCFPNDTLWRQIKPRPLVCFSPVFQFPTLRQICFLFFNHVVTCPRCCYPFTAPATMPSR